MIEFEGHSFDMRTVMMINAARVLCPAPMIITQGSYSHAAASAGTHSGGGAVDIRASDRTAAERAQIVSSMRRVGFAAWLRTPAQANWPYHVHGIAVGCSDLSPEAAAQVVDYRNDRNGLASHGKDDGPRDWVGQQWEQFIGNNDDMKLEIGMALSAEALAQIAHTVRGQVDAAIAANEAKNGNAAYAKAFWVSKSGTGTAIRAQLVNIATAVSADLTIDKQDLAADNKPV